jgi:hypothetical protein
LEVLAEESNAMVLTLTVPILVFAIVPVDVVLIDSVFTQ